MNPNTEVFDPTARPEAAIKLLGTDYVVAELTKGRTKRLAEVETKIEAADQANLDEAIPMIGELFEIALEGGEGLANRLCAAWDEDRISANTVIRSLEYVRDQIYGSDQGNE